MKILNTKEFLERLNIGKLNIRDIKLPKPRLLPDELVEKYKLVFSKTTNRYDCDGDVKIEKDLVEDGRLITDFGVVKGNFDCYDTGLTSLEGCPAKVYGKFWCSFNQLTSLEGCPTEVGKYFACSDNQLTSLKGGPIKVDGDFYCSHNRLVSLEGSPAEVSGSFNCADNNLTSLKNCTVEIGGYFDCSENSLTSLEGCPAKVGDNFWCSRQKNGHKFTVDEVKALCDVKYKINI